MHKIEMLDLHSRRVQRRRQNMISERQDVHANGGGRESSCHVTLMPKSFRGMPFCAQKWTAMLDRGFYVSLELYLAKGGHSGSCEKTKDGWQGISSERLLPLSSYQIPCNNPHTTSNHGLLLWVSHKSNCNQEYINNRLSLRYWTLTLHENPNKSLSVICHNTGNQDLAFKSCLA